MKIPIYRSWYPSTVSTFPIPVYAFEPVEGVEPGEVLSLPQGFPGSGDEPWSYLNVPGGSRLERRGHAKLLDYEDLFPDDEDLWLILPNGREMCAADAILPFADPEVKQAHDQAMKMLSYSTSACPQAN